MVEKLGILMERLPWDAKQEGIWPFESLSLSSARCIYTGVVGTGGEINTVLSSEISNLQLAYSLG